MTQELITIWSFCLVLVLLFALFDRIMRKRRIRQLVYRHTSLEDFCKDDHDWTSCQSIADSSRIEARLPNGARVSVLFKGMALKAIEVDGHLMRSEDQPLIVGLYDRVELKARTLLGIATEADYALSSDI